MIQTISKSIRSLFLLLAICSTISNSTVAIAADAPNDNQAGGLLFVNEDDDEDGGDGTAHDAVRLNIIAFEMRDKGFTFDKLITGTYAQLFQAFEGKADVIFLNRTPVIRDGDVLNIQEDALRMAGDNLANDGLNCTFSFSNLSDEDSEFYAISGMCHLLYANEAGTRKVRAVVKRTTLSEANYGVNAWISIYEDKEAGVILYADVDPE